AAAQRTILEAQEDTRVARTEAERLAVTHEATLTEKARLEGASAATPPPAPAAAPTTAQPVVLTPPDTRVVAVLDTASTWPATAGVDVRVIAPGDEVVGRMGELGAGRCIVNLAAAGAVTSAAALRAAGVGVPLWGTIVVPSGERGLALGQIEVL